MRVSWQLDRADSHERARLTRRLREAPRDRDRARDLAVAVLMSRLLDGGEAPEPTGPPGGKDARCEGLGEVLARLEASAEGCRRLLAEWAAVKDEVDEKIGQAYEPPASLEDLGLIGQGRILRLLGLTDEHAAIRARLDGRVAAIVRIRDVMQRAAIVAFLAQGREEDPDLLEDEDEDDPPDEEPEPRPARPVFDDRQWTALGRSSGRPSRSSRAGSRSSWPRSRPRRTPRKARPTRRRPSTIRRGRAAAPLPVPLEPLAAANPRRDRQASQRPTGRRGPSRGGLEGRRGFARGPGSGRCGRGGHGHFRGGGTVGPSASCHASADRASGRSW